MHASLLYISLLKVFLQYAQVPLEAMLGQCSAWAQLMSLCSQESNLTRPSASRGSIQMQHV